MSDLFVAIWNLIINTLIVILCDLFLGALRLLGVELSLEIERHSEIDDTHEDIRGQTAI